MVNFIKRFRLIYVRRRYICRQEGFELKTRQFLEEVMDEHTEYLYRIAYYYVKDTYKAEDIVQDVFIKFYTSRYEERGELKAYLARMTANACKDYLKSWAYRKLKWSETFLKTEQFTDKDRIVEKEELQELDRAILALPLKKREVIVYYYLENMPVKDIAKLLNCPESTIKSRIQSGRSELKNLLDDEEWEVLTVE